MMKCLKLNHPLTILDHQKINTENISLWRERNSKMAVPKDGSIPSTRASAESQSSEEDFVIVSNGGRKSKSSVQSSGSVSEQEYSLVPKDESNPSTLGSEEDFVVVSDGGKKAKSAVQASSSSVSEQENNSTVSDATLVSFTTTREDLETPQFLTAPFRVNIRENYKHPAHQLSKYSNWNTEPSDQMTTPASATPEFNPRYLEMLHYMLHMYQLDQIPFMEIKKCFTNVGFPLPGLFILGVIGVLIPLTQRWSYRRDCYVKSAITKRLQVFDFIVELHRNGKTVEEVLEVCFANVRSILDSARMGHNTEEFLGDEILSYRASRQFVKDLMLFAKIQKNS